MSTVCVSGYYDVLHVGHLEYFRLAKELTGDLGKLIVIVNNDHQAKLKKGRSFMPEKERVQIIRALNMVDEVYLSIDTDRSVCRTIEHIHTHHTRIHIFANGGDRWTGNIPEVTVCERLHIQLVDGLGE